MRRTCYESTLRGVNWANTFLIGAIYAMRQTKRTKDNMPLPLVIRLILSFSLTGSAIWIWLQDPSVEYSTGCTWYDFIDCGRFVYGWADSNWSQVNWWMVTFALAHCFM